MHDERICQLINLFVREWAEYKFAAARNDGDNNNYIILYIVLYCITIIL